MINDDTIKLLRECDAGVKMGVDSIEEVLKYAKDEKLRTLLSNCKKEHEKLDKEIREALHRFHDEGKNPNPIAKTMSTLKTEFKMGMNESDKTVANLITDGCNMGVKSLNKYLNEYKAADNAIKDITKRLIRIEEKLAEDLAEYL